MNNLFRPLKRKCAPVSLLICFRVFPLRPITTPWKPSGISTNSSLSSFSWLRTENVRRKEISTVSPENVNKMRCRETIEKVNCKRRFSLQCFVSVFNSKFHLPQDIWCSIGSSASHPVVVDQLGFGPCRILQYHLERQPTLVGPMDFSSDFSIRSLYERN